MNNYKDLYIKYKKKYFSLKYGGMNSHSNDDYKSFDKLMDDDKKTHNIKQEHFIELIYKSSPNVHSLLNKILINLVVKHNKYKDRVRNFRFYKIKDHVAVGNYEIDSRDKEYKEILSIINVLKNITIINNGSKINGLQFFILLSNLIAIDHGNKETTDNHSTADYIKTIKDNEKLESKKKVLLDLNENYNDLKKEKMNINSELASHEAKIAEIAYTSLIKLQKFMPEIVPFLKRHEILFKEKKENTNEIKKFNAAIADNVYMQLSEFMPELKDIFDADGILRDKKDNEAIGLDDEHNNDILNTNIDPFLKKIIKLTSKRNELNKKIKEIDDKINTIKETINEWNVFTSISKESKNLLLILSDKNFEQKNFLKNFYTDYHKHTKHNKRKTYHKYIKDIKWL